MARNLLRVCVLKFVILCGKLCTYVCLRVARVFILSRHTWLEFICSQVHVSSGIREIKIDFNSAYVSVASVNSRN